MRKIVLYSISYKIKSTQTPLPFAIHQNPNSVNLCKKNLIQEPSFTLNATLGTEEINQIPSSFNSLISLDI